MTFDIRFTEEAKAELTDITEYIARDSLPNAKRFIAEISEKYKTVLSVFPESGKVYKNEIRQISFRGYTAFYSVNEKQKTVYVLHIIDLSKPLEEREIDL